MKKTWPFKVHSMSTTVETRVIGRLVPLVVINIMAPGCNLLLQYLSKNDPNQYTTPPAQKEAVEALPTVSIKDNLQCSVCLKDIKMGTEAKEMPCKHKFHDGCILPWLELHSSCLVFQFQLPLYYKKIESNANRNGQSSGRVGPEGVGSYSMVL
ncbi:hypothetical protein V6N12_027243 [Hibiscus sabdariffa]|uniref:RING-type E3 ubiquitin transferase n=1 Tax=Hibiscus sabdariffa TaxID=183260 RepID=A0ABR2DU50_9ROSI